MIKNNIVYNPILEYQFTLQKAEGSLLWTKEGKKLIDFTSGWNITNLGWNNPEVTEAIKQQLSKNTYTPSWIADEMQQKYASTLLAQLPKQLNAICRVTSGTEANEQAIKIARTVTGRKKILGFFDSYHGSTFASLSVGYRPEYLENLAPVVGEMIHLEYPRLAPGVSEKDVLQSFTEQLEEVLGKKDVAAILTEAGMITGWGSMSVAPTGFLKDVKKVAEKYGTLVILDEVGTGFSRCGALFAHQLEDVVPDILTLAKAMTNGTSSMGACIVNEDLIADVISEAKVLSSLAWMPLACAAADKTLEIHLRDRVWEKAKEHGQYIVNLLQKSDLKVETYIRGRGMEIGIDFKKHAPETENFNFTSAVVRRAFNSGLLVMQSDASTIQIMPPLTTPKNLLDEGLEILIKAIKSTKT